MSNLQIFFELVLWFIELYMIFGHWIFYLIWILLAYLIVCTDIYQECTLNLTTEVYGFSVAVMTRAYPESSTEGNDLILLQNVGSYVLLACGVVYVVLVSSAIYLYKSAQLFYTQGLIFYLNLLHVLLVSGSSNLGY